MSDEAQVAPGGSGGSDATVGSDGSVDAVWLDGGRLLALVTMGSSGAVPRAEQITADGQDLTVELSVPDGPTTRDWRPRLTLVGVPAGVDPTRDATLTLTGAITGVAVVPGRAQQASTAPGTPTDYAPSAAWTSVEGQFVLLTWGSSVPPLEVEASTVDATDPSDVLVRFAPPATPMATMDMAPRLTLAYVSTPVARPATAVLSGRVGLEGVRVPILG